MQVSVLRLKLEIVRRKSFFFFFFAEVSELLGCKSRANETLHGNELSVFEDKERWKKNKS